MKNTFASLPGVAGLGRLLAMLAAGAVLLAGTLMTTELPAKVRVVVSPSTGCPHAPHARATTLADAVRSHFVRSAKPRCSGSILDAPRHAAAARSMTSRSSCAFPGHA